MPKRMKMLFKFQYKARYKDIGSENELCAVLVGDCPGDIKLDADPREIMEWKFVDVDSLREDMKKNPSSYTPWFRMEIDNVLASR